MKQNEFEDLPQLSLFRYENFFDIYIDPNNNEKYYNIIKSVNVFQSNNSDIETIHIAAESDTWYSISYKYYNILDLWWLICCYNQIINPTKRPTPGSTVKVLNRQYVSVVLEELYKQLNR